MQKMSLLQNNQQIQDIRPEQTQGAMAFQNVIKSLIGELHTLQLCEVVSINSVGEVDSVGLCSIRPMVKLIDGSNNAYDRGVVENVPYFRFQGGKNAVICDPQVGDIGLGLFCERDISMVKRNKVQSAPNNKRQYDLNDAVYLGGFLNGTPSQYIQFLENGINIRSTGDVNINGMTIKSTGEIVTKGGVVLDTHIHSQGSDSHGDKEQDTGVPHG